MNWTQQFDTFCFLDNHQYHIAPHTQECLVAAGIKRKLDDSSPQALTALQDFIDAGKGGWLFGHLAYDVKTGPDTSAVMKPDRIGFPDIFFFEPATLVKLNPTTLIIEAEEPEKIYAAITAADSPSSVPGAPVSIQSRLTREAYISIINQLKQHILRGDCYEINFCQEFFADGAVIDPAAVYRELSTISPNPFSAFYRLQDKWLLCASPERFLQKQGSKLLSQPIKGTAKRIPGDAARDMQNREELFASSKDRSENVMVVDLVRNDLSKVCKEGSVQVEELYGIYSFPQVHQMISTISGELKEGIPFTEIIEATFPMGSMTGAPKKRVMELIGQYEQAKRGIFSGAIGYLSPAGDFDFNVVIRSMMYNASRRYLSFQAGSGITFYSEAEQEWEECLLKAEAITKALGQTGNK